MHTPTHPHAQAAIELANRNHFDRAHFNQVKSDTGMPLSLYTLARILRAAKLTDDIEAMHQPAFAQAA